MSTIFALTIVQVLLSSVGEAGHSKSGQSLRQGRTLIQPTYENEQKVILVFRGKAIMISKLAKAQTGLFVHMADGGYQWDHHNNVKRLAKGD